MTPVHAIVENVSRRGFLKGIIAGGSLVVAGQFLPARAALAYATGAAKMAGGVVSDPHVFVSIAPDGIVTIPLGSIETNTCGSLTTPPAIFAAPVA